MSADKVTDYYRQGLTALDAESSASAIDWFTRVSSPAPPRMHATLTTRPALNHAGLIINIR